MSNGGNSSVNLAAASAGQPDATNYVLNAASVYTAEQAEKQSITGKQQISLVQQQHELQQLQQLQQQQQAMMFAPQQQIYSAPAPFSPFPAIPPQFPSSVSAQQFMAATQFQAVLQSPLPADLMNMLIQNTNNNGNTGVIGMPAAQSTSFGNSAQPGSDTFVAPKLPTSPQITTGMLHNEARGRGLQDKTGVSLAADLDEANAASCSSDGSEFRSGRIRKRRYSMARIQPTRIKKVMQSDEDIGRMVASVPVAIGSAMELFAEQLLQNGAEALQQGSAKTLSPAHIKKAVMCTPYFSFLEPLLREVPMNSNAGGGPNMP